MKSRAPKNKTLFLIQKGCIASLLVVIILFFAFFTGPRYRPRETDIANSTVMQQVTVRLEKQKKIDAQLLAELESGAYTFEEPFIVQDPYGVSPLTVLILFHTEEPVEVSITVKGKDKYSDVSFRFDGYQTEHQIPVYGLYAGKSNEVALTAISKNGTKEVKRFDIVTEDLPSQFQNLNIDVITLDAEQYYPGYNFTYDNNGIAAKMAFDLHGEIRWYLNNPVPDSTALSTNYLYQGHQIVAYGAYHYGDVIVTEQDLLGRIYHIWYSPYGVHHDITSLPNSNLLITGSMDRDSVEDIITEIDVKTGETINLLDFKTIFDPARPPLPVSNFEKTSSDWLHLNAIVSFDDGKSIIISSRHQSMVAKLAYPSGEIQWILGPHDNYLPKTEKYLLAPIGTDFEWSWGQHAPQILPDFDNNPDTLDLLLFDNGNSRSFVDQEVLPDSENHSRYVWYRINEKELTVEQMWEYGKERGNEIYAHERGNVSLLGNNHLWGYFNVDRHQEYGEYIEVTFDEAKEVVFEVSITTKTGDIYSDYRVTRKDFYLANDTDYDIKHQPQNLIPPELQ